MLDTSNMPDTHPSDVDPEVGFFDRFATRASHFVSRAPFFAFCVILVVVWAPTMFLMKLDTSQLIINTATTIITFLMVAILQNSQTRFEAATNKKLNAIADALSDLLEWSAANVGKLDQAVQDELMRDAEELRTAVGLEHREST
jgi:low affinity Fe/Cu permease